VQAHVDAQTQKEAQSKQQNATPASGGEGGIEGLEEEAGQQGAFNPETGEINWDCPCLGGMATGPCGEEFKAAFSCFVFSEEEPKGMDCIDKFKYVEKIEGTVTWMKANKSSGACKTASVNTQTFTAQNSSPMPQTTRTS
jgi:hypothetical protein